VKIAALRVQVELEISRFAIILVTGQLFDLFIGEQPPDSVSIWNERKSRAFRSETVYEKSNGIVNSLLHLLFIWTI
jgi:hypothetical protein